MRQQPSGHVPAAAEAIAEAAAAACQSREMLPARRLVGHCFDGEKIAILQQRLCSVVVQHLQAPLISTRLEVLQAMCSHQSPDSNWALKGKPVTLQLSLLRLDCKLQLQQLHEKMI